MLYNKKFCDILRGIEKSSHIPDPFGVELVHLGNLL